MVDYKAPVRRFIEETFIVGSDELRLEDSDSFMDRHVVDSTGFLELILFLEETWAVTVEDTEIVPENLDSLDGLQAYLTRKLGP
jgi:acyl carrier protein